MKIAGVLPTILSVVYSIKAQGVKYNTVTLSPRDTGHFDDLHILKAKGLSYGVSMPLSHLVYSPLTR